jgi:hypothetical protein
MFDSPALSKLKNILSHLQQGSSLFILYIIYSERFRVPISLSVFMNYGVFFVFFGYFVDCHLAQILVVDCRLKRQNSCRL